MNKNILILIAILFFFSTQATVQAEKSSVTNTNTKILSADLRQTPASIDNLVGHFGNKIRIVFSDIDGTLMPTGKNAVKGKVPESVKSGYKKLEQAQIPLILATGRSSWEGKQIAKKMGNGNSYVIAQQGAEIMAPDGKIVYQDTLSHNDTIKMLKDIDSFKKIHHLNSKVFFFANGVPYATEDFELPYIFEKRTVIKSYKELGKNLDFTKISICETNPEKLKLIQAHLKKKFPNYHIDISADCYCDITSATATKGNAIEKLSKILGVDLKNAAVLGDAENDINMLKLIKTKGGLAIAVGNAIDSVKSNANFITATVYDGGFAKAVDKILENNTVIQTDKIEIIGTKH